MLISIIFLIHFYFNLMGSMIILYKMRFDNPINEHFVEFPDIASFPELNDEYRFQKEVDLSPLYDSHDDGNFEKFNEEFDEHAIRISGNFQIGKGSYKNLISQKHVDAICGSEKYICEKFKYSNNIN